MLLQIFTLCFNFLSLWYFLFSQVKYNTSTKCITRGILHPYVKINIQLSQSVFVSHTLILLTNKCLPLQLPALREVMLVLKKFIPE